MSARLRTFRRLCLAFALFTVGGIAATLGFLPATTAAHRNEAAATAIALLGLWLYGHYRGRFSLAWLPIEIATLVGFVHGIANPIAVLGVCYVGVQYRALYGGRRDAALVGGAYILAFVLGLAFMPDGPGVMRPVVAVEIVAIGFCAYLLHTLSEALQRDGDRTSVLQRSEDNYRLLFEHNPWPMFVVDPHTLRILRVNGMAVSQYGYTRDELLGMTLRELRPAEDRAALEQLRPQIESDSRFTSLVRHRKRDGTIIDVEITIDSVELEGGRARLGLAVDVTNRERSERALRESEQRFRAVAENLREALLITDTEDRIVLANARVHEVLGYTPEEVLGKNATELLLPESQRHVFRDRLRQRMSGASELYETEMVRKDGQRIYAEVSASPYRDASGLIIGTLGAISDISERKRLEERLRQGMRMEAVGQLAGGVAHDFNNMLTVIKINTELLLAELPRDAPLRQGIVDIARSADRGASLTQQLLAFGRKQLLQPRRVMLAELVADAGPMLRKLVGRHVSVVTLHDNSTDQVFADPLQLEHVLVTLVRNANDAMPNGGRITIETRALELADERPPVATQEMPTGRYTMLSVSDTGTGMAPDVVVRLFEPFFTTKGPGEGTALGLASMYGVVRQSGGHVDVESAPNQGTTFRIYLPLAQAKALSELPVPTLQQA